MKTLRNEIPVVLVEQTPARPFNWLPKVRAFVAKVLFNLIPIGIVAAFFWLQAQIQSQGGEGWLTKIELGMTVIIEFALVFIWSLFLEGK